MEQNEIITALHTQLKEAAQRVFAELKIRPGKYSATEADKALNLSGMMDEIAAARYESRQYPATEQRNAAKIAGVMADLDTAGIPDEIITITCEAFNASMPAALVFAKLAEWEKTFKIKTADKAIFIKEEEGEVIASCVVEFPKEAKHIANYVGADPWKPVLMGVCLDVVNSCIVATDTHVLTEIPVIVSSIEGELNKLIIDPKVIKAVAGQRCEIRLIKDAEKNISIRTEKGDVYTCENIKGNYPNYRRVYPKVNRDGLVEIADIKSLATFAKGVVKQAKSAGKSEPCILIEIPAYSAEGTATYFDDYTQTARSIKFALKGSPRIDVVFGMSAPVLAIVAKNWDGCLWFCDPSRPIVFDNTNTTCTIAMPMQSDCKTELVAGSCAGIVDAIDRRNYNAAEMKETEQRQAEEKRISEEALTITRAEKEECALHYCKTKGVMADIVTDADEIIAVTPNGCRVRYSGRFRRSVDIVLFERTKETIISIPAEEPPATPPDKAQEPPEATKKGAPPDTSHQTPPKHKQLILHHHAWHYNLVYHHRDNSDLHMPRNSHCVGCDLRTSRPFRLNSHLACQMVRQERSHPTCRGRPGR